MAKHKLNRPASIRPYAAGDYLAALKLFSEFRYSQDGLPPGIAEPSAFPRSALKDEFEGLISRSESWGGGLWVAQDGAILVGFIETIPSGNEEGEIPYWFVASSHREKGIGCQLVEQAIAWAHSERLKSITAMVLGGNDPAFAALSKCGFRVVGTLVPGDYKATVLKLEL